MQKFQMIPKKFIYILFKKKRPCSHDMGKADNFCLVVVEFRLFNEKPTFL